MEINIQERGDGWAGWGSEVKDNRANILEKMRVGGSVDQTQKRGKEIIIYSCIALGKYTGC